MKNICHSLDIIFTSKFGDRSIHFKIKRNITKLIIQIVQFAMLCVCNTDTRAHKYLHNILTFLQYKNPRFTYNKRAIKHIIIAYIII